MCCVDSGKTGNEVDVTKYGRGSRQRSVIAYADNMTDDVFQAMLESGATVGEFTFPHLVDGFLVNCILL